MTDKVIEAVKEASISVAWLLDDVAVNEDDILNGELDLNVLQKDIEHLQNQITIIENFIYLVIITNIGVKIHTILKRI